MDYSSWGRKESDMTERLHFNDHFSVHIQALKLKTAATTPEKWMGAGAGGVANKRYYI